MLSFCKKYLTRLCLVSLIFISNYAFAQYPGMGAMRAASNMQMINQMAMLRNLGMNIGAASPDVYDFEVTMLDSTKKEIVSAIYNNGASNKKFIVLEDKSLKRSDTNRYRKIYPSQTLGIVETFTEAPETGNDTAIVKHAYGRPADSCWMFNIKAGTISLLSYSCEGWDSRYSPATIVGLQLEGAPAVQFTPANLHSIIAGNPEAMKYFEKKKYFKAIEKYNNDTEKATYK